MSAQILLNGITWNHSRGMLPLVATAQRFAELHPGVEIVWQKRSLQAFADVNVDDLARQFDLLVIDHPWAGYAAARGSLLPLQEFLPQEYLADQAANSVGLSHPSYQFNGVQVALAIDAATPVAAWRPDLLAQQDLRLPTSWQDLLGLARAGWVAFPGIALDTLMNFYMLCSTQGCDPFVDDEWAVPDVLGVSVLEQMRELAALVTREIFQWNPIAVYEALSTRDDLAYCPFAYGYSNYARRGYGRRRLQYGDMVELAGKRLRTTLGGTGLAISAYSSQRTLAVEYGRFAASLEVQRGLYVDNGGQPAHKQAWLDEEANRVTGGYFANTLPVLERAYLRPRFPGYLHFQDHGGEPVQEYLMDGGDPRSVLGQLKALFQEAKQKG